MPSVLPVPIAGYFYNGTGSNFPLFPWAAYLLAGGILGNYLAKNPDVFKSSRFSFYLAAWGSSLILLGLIGNILETNIFIISACVFVLDNASFV